jgi:hypothetical protein
MAGSNPGKAVGGDPLISRRQVEEVLQRVGWTPDRIDMVLDDVKFPDTLSNLAVFLGHHGITRERLMDRMGASP